MKPWQASLSAANVHDSREFETMVPADEEMVVADKAHWSHARSQWCGQHGINGIVRKANRGKKPLAATMRVNRLSSAIEKVFAEWKRCTGSRRVRCVGGSSTCWNSP